MLNTKPETEATGEPSLQLPSRQPPEACTRTAISPSPSPSNKNLDKLSNCLKNLNHSFSIIGLTETQLNDEPSGHLHLQNYNLEYMNRVGRKSGGVCLYIRNDIKYKVRQDLCKANSNFESCFIEIENGKCRNILVGGIYRSHTPIYDFNADFKHILPLIPYKFVHVNTIIS